MKLPRISPPLVLAALAALALSASAPRAQARWSNQYAKVHSAHEIEKLVAQLPLSVKVGQLFIFGFHGTNSEALSATLQELQPGGLIVFGRNIQTARQMAKLNQDIQEISLRAGGLPALIALDQEGGDVTRIRLTPPLPSALALGMTNDPTLAHRLGHVVGELIRSMGFNMNLAPVLDLSDPSKATFIGTRSFGNQPTLVGDMAVAFAQGLDEAGILATGKHFPGHGNTLSDSHHLVPGKTTSLSELLATDLLPYQLFKQRLRSSAIMLAHVAFPHIDQSRTPATFSRVIVTDLLRNRLQYPGLIITDDIEMKAAENAGGFAERVLRALEAGADMILVAWNKRAQRASVQAVLAAVKSGRLSEEQINAAVRRILHAKSAYFSLHQAPAPELNLFRDVIQSHALKDIADEILHKNFYHSLLTLPESAYFTNAQPLALFAARKDFRQGFLAAAPLGSEIIDAPPFQRTADKYVAALQTNPARLGVFYVTGRITARLANALPAVIKSRTLIVSASSPGFLASPQAFRGVMNIYSDHPEAGKLTAKNLIFSRVIDAQSDLVSSK